MAEDDSVNPVIIENQLEKWCCILMRFYSVGDLNATCGCLQKKSVKETSGDIENCKSLRTTLLVFGKHQTSELNVRLSM